VDAEGRGDRFRKLNLQGLHDYHDHAEDRRWATSSWTESDRPECIGVKTEFLRISPPDPDGDRPASTTADGS